jgi:hypothetical protein
MSSPSADKLTGIWAKTERTKKHIADLESAISGFLDTGPYKVGTKRDPNTRKLIYYVSHVDNVPCEVTLIAGDAISNMVSILDHLALRLFLKNTPGEKGRHVYFPISRNAKTRAEHETSCQGKVQGIDPTIIAALYALEAHQGGKGHHLWILNELNNLSKHRELIAVGSSYRSLDLGAYMMADMEKLLGRSLPSLSAFYKPADPLCPLKIGDELFIGAPDDEPNKKMQFRFDVALNEPQIIQAKPLIETINEFFGLIDGIVKQFVAYL